MSADWGNRKGAVRAAAALGLVTGGVLAWIDTRPRWDDTGILAGLLFLGSGCVAALGAPWWLATMLVAGPIFAVELRSARPGILVVLAIAGVGALVGQGVRRLGRPGRGEP